MMTNDSHSPIDINAFKQRDPLVNVNPPKPEHIGHVPTQAVLRETNSMGESVYLIEIVKGLFITLGKMMSQLVGWKQIPTVHYPEVTRDIPEGYRGKHRLTTREDGTSKCVACMMCATACPAECIHIIPAESEDPDVERYPDRFDIDLLECVFCGMCVEACPVDAIRMDSGVYSLTAFDRESFMVTKEELLAVKPNPHVRGQVV
ncbi:MAG: NADH-quinone oxidoreductase, chain [Cyanobacteria bacterium RYN_339]|nr:NADH-quinone oxidoreductase, chain [Cyanobacteria bacterium RYN_339]